ncbi:hypothetical protein ACSMXN_06310 [Jatrophihabitans sp. DSM 45814]
MSKPRLASVVSEPAPEADLSWPASMVLTPLPKLDGDLDVTLEMSPVFRPRRHGYSTIEVDNYVAWVEGELRAARGSCQAVLHEFAELAGQLATCRAELDALKLSGSDSAELPIPEWASNRVRAILQLAAEEADDVRAAARADAVALRTEMLAEARAVLRQAQWQAQQIIGSGERAADFRVAAAEQQVLALRRERDQLVGALGRLLDSLDDAVVGASSVPIK